MSDYTPGPWGTKKTNDGSTAVFSGETGNWVAAVFKSTPITQQANARLIASAPALLEQLIRITKAVESWNASVETIIGRQLKTGIDLDQAKSAIAKATGVAP